MYHCSNGLLIIASGSSSCLSLIVRRRQRHCNRRWCIYSSRPQRRLCLPTRNDFFSRRKLSPVFDRRANGSVPGSGGGVVVSNFPQQAIRDGDTVPVAPVIGTAVNNDGVSKASFMAPSARGHQTVIERSPLEAAQLTTSDIQLVESSKYTALGDRLELSALFQTYGKLGDNDNGCALGTLKAMTRTSR